MTPGKFKPPYHGAAYYPEDWPLEQIDEDIRWMKEAGMNVMRIGEFAWSSMEPEEGKYTFDWLHLVVDKLAKAGIATIMGTPTCTPPAWLLERYPEVNFIRENGKPVGHGSRRHTCPNSPVYRELCEKIVTRMAIEFGQDERIIGWQIDNEVYPYAGSRSCCCPVCQRKFQDFMKNRYGSIEKLNEAWCNSLWSQTYSSFDQLPVPATDVWHHPALLTAWEEFASHSYVDFVKHQADLLHRLTRHPIGTDMMMITGVDHYEMHKSLDLVQYNHYHGMENLHEAAFWFDYIRPIKEVPYWNTETATCWGGGVVAAGYKDPGFCRANTWMAFALGGEANLYWLWRQHWTGQELMHGAVLTSCGRPMHIFGEVQEISRGLTAAAEFLRETRPIRTGLAMHYSQHAYWLFRNQPMVQNFNYNYETWWNYYKPLIQSQIRFDAISPDYDLSAYRVILSPFLPALDEGGLRERLISWIREGGIWIAGPLTDIRTLDCAKYRHAPFGSLEEWAQVHLKYSIQCDSRKWNIAWPDGSESPGTVYYDGYETSAGETLATYSEGPLKGLSAVTSTNVGKGKILLMGTLPPANQLVSLVKQAAELKEIHPVADASPNLLVVPRSGSELKGMIIVEWENKPGRVRVEKPMTNLLNGSLVCGETTVEPYDVLVLQEHN